MADKTNPTQPVETQNASSPSVNEQNVRVSATDADKAKDKHLTITFRFTNADNDKALRNALTKDGAVGVTAGEFTQNDWAKRIIAQHINADMAKEVKRSKTPKSALPAPLAALSAPKRAKAQKLMLAEIAANPEKYAAVLALLNGISENVEQAERQADAAKLEASLTQ